MMEDHEIRDVMGRSRDPKIELEFEIVATTRRVSNLSQYEKLSQSLNPIGVRKREEFTAKIFYELRVSATNRGGVYARYVNAHLKLPIEIMRKKDADAQRPTMIDGHEYGTLFEDNTGRDVVDTDVGLFGVREKLGPSIYHPVLPGLRCDWEFDLKTNLALKPVQDLEIQWTVYADNAPPRSGGMRIGDIPVTQESEERNEDDEVGEDEDDEIV
jgi:hypothetical protein